MGHLTSWAVMGRNPNSEATFARSSEHPPSSGQAFFRGSLSNLLRDPISWSDPIRIQCFSSADSPRTGSQRILGDLRSSGSTETLGPAIWGRTERRRGRMEPCYTSPVLVFWGIPCLFAESLAPLFCVGKVMRSVLEGRSITATACSSTKVAKNSMCKVSKLLLTMSALRTLARTGPPSAFRLRDWKCYRHGENTCGSKFALFHRCSV